MAASTSVYVSLSLTGGPLAHTCRKAVRRSNAAVRSFSYSQRAGKPPTAFAFDIDGVLKQGENVLPEGRKALQILTGQNRQNKSYPFVLITNGGGMTETDRSARLSEELGVRITPKQLVQSHTVFRSFVPEYHDKPILVVGGKGTSMRPVAESYGFKKVYIPLDILAWRPEVYPFASVPKDSDVSNQLKVEDFSKIDFHAIFIAHDPRNWGLDIQIIIDLLLASRPPSPTSTSSPTSNITDPQKDPNDPSCRFDPDHQIPLRFSNPDIIWGNEWPEPRLGQGAFQAALKGTWDARTRGRHLFSTTYGKPTKGTYDYASTLLKSLLYQFESRSAGQDRERVLNDPSVDVSEGTADLGPVYMIGDNPYSDIQGANAYGWNSVLVRTGVFRGGDNHPEHPATAVRDNVLDAVKWALANEGESL